MKVGDLVKTTDPSRLPGYPKGMGIVVGYRDEGLHEMYNTVYVMWPNTGDQRSVRQMFLELVSASR